MRALVAVLTLHDLFVSVSLYVCDTCNNIVSCVCGFVLHVFRCIHQCFCGAPALKYNKVGGKLVWSVCVCVYVLLGSVWVCVCASMCVICVCLCVCMCVCVFCPPGFFPFRTVFCCGLPRWTTRPYTS